MPWLILLTALTAHGAPRIVGGQPSEPGVWPDTVAVKLQGSYQCTGTLVAPRLVLTAAHCDSNIESVLVNSTDYADSSQGEEIPVVASYSYPRPYETYDVAVLVLEYEASVPARTVAARCVTDTHLYDGAAVTAVGFGSTSLSGWGGNSVLHQVQVEVVDHDCSESGRGCNQDVQPGGELIAGGGGLDSCNGDSGGPLYLATPDGWQLVGITSRAAYPLTNNCGDGGIYARADPIIDWAEDVTGLAVTRPDCENVGEPANRPPEPTADDMRLPAGDTAISQVWANDPDSAQAHVYEVVSGPAFGTATIDGAGSASFRAPPESEGSTSFFVRVTDDGEPPLFADLEIRVEVEPAPVEQDTGEPVNPGDSAEPSEVTLQAGGCSCSQGLAHPAGMALFAVPFAAIRRRSRLRGR